MAVAMIATPAGVALSHEEAASPGSPAVALLSGKEREAGRDKLRWAEAVFIAQHGMDMKDRRA